MNKLSIIVPVYNEGKTIDKIISKIRASDIGLLEKEIILVDDYSTDGSRDLLTRFESSDIKVLFNDKNLGKGGAVKHGFSKASGDIFIIQDADLEYEPADYKQVIKPILEGKVQAVLGVRTLNKEENNRNGLFYNLGNNVITLFTNILYANNAAEYTGCYKAFTKDLIKSIKVNSNDFAYEHELVCKILKRGYKTVDVPIHYYPRNYAEGKKINWKDGIKILWAVVKYRFTD